MISGFSSNREEFCSKTWYPTMKKNCGSCEDCGVDVRTKATLSASNRLFMERGKKSLSGELEAVARYFVRNVETSLLGKLK